MLLGDLSRRIGLGCSVDSAKDANVSIMIFIQINWIGDKGYWSIKIIPTRVKATATQLTVNWNWINFLKESYIFLPHKTDFKIELKLSSIKITEEDYWAKLEPDIPAEKLTSAIYID